MNVKKKPSKSTLFLYVLIAVPLISALVYAVITYGMKVRREHNIIKDMESVYTEAEFVAIKCDKKPVDKAELEEQYLWFGDGLPEDDLYEFLISDSEDNTAIGYATKDGTVVFDTYACKYYADEAIDFFKEVVDFEHNFPELQYCIPEINIINECRIVLTHDCTSFEGYKTAGTIGYYFFGSGGYPGLFVVLDDASKETIQAINVLLADAEFDMYILYAGAKGDFSDVRHLDFDDSDGSYYPFGAPYDEVVLGK